jgi:hypothetical protein
MEKSSQIAWKIVPLRHFFSLKVVPLIEVLLYRLWAYSIPPYKRSPYNVRIPLSDILGRRRPVGFVRESYPLRGGTL